MQSRFGLEMACSKNTACAVYECDSELSASIVDRCKGLVASSKLDSRKMDHECQRKSSIYFGSFWGSVFGHKNARDIIIFLLEVYCMHLKS